MGGCARRTRPPHRGKLWAAVALIAVAGYVRPVWQARKLTALRAPSRHIAGAYHVHSHRSHDSSVTPAAWAKAARAVGLDFIVLTDHNVEPKPPRMLEDVLVLFEREASLPVGHLVQWQGAAIAAHPFDRHRPWLAPLTRLTGLEVASASAAARALAGPLGVGIVPALVMGLAKPELGIAQLYARDDRALGLWDGPGTQREVLAAGLCSADAHGWLPLRHELSVWRMVLPQMPTTRPLRPEQAPDILAALAAGRSLCASGLLPAEAQVTLEATPGTPHAPAHVTAEASLAPSLKARLSLLRDGIEVCSTYARQCQVMAPAPGVYRAEVIFEVPQLLGPARCVPLLYSGRLRLPENLP